MNQFSFHVLKISMAETSGRSNKVGYSIARNKNKWFLQNQTVFLDKHPYNFATLSLKCQGNKIGPQIYITLRRETGQISEILSKFS